jgi:hypothetical protein
MSVDNTRTVYVVANTGQSVLTEYRWEKWHCANLCRLCSGQQNEFIVPVMISEVRLGIISEQNVKRNLYNPWSEFQAKFVSLVFGMSSRLSVIRDRNVKQNVYHLWTGYQAEFLSSVNRMSSKICIICNQKVKQSFCHPWSECQAEFVSAYKKNRHLPQLPSKNCPRAVAYRGGFGVFNPPPPPRNSEVLTKSNRIANWAENV